MSVNHDNYPVTGKRDFSGELEFSASRSSGPGGQNVNKVNTKIELRFHILSSKLLTDIEKDILLKKLKNRITDDGYLYLVSQSERTQFKNREKAINKFHEIINNALTIKKKRKLTRPTLSSVEKRLFRKKTRSEVKKLRKKI
jgi:ribosome-associated protein